MNFKEAKTRAKIKARKYRPLLVSGEYETDSCWVFVMAHPDGEAPIANIPYLVFDKEGRGAREITLPSAEGFSIMREIRPINER